MTSGAAELGPAGLVALAVGTMLAALWLCSHVSGWRRLAGRFGWEGQAEGRRFGWVSLGFGTFMWYNHCLTVTAGPRGLRLVMQPLMRLFHPGVLIPWDRILGVEAWGGMLMRGIALRLDGSPSLLIFKRRDYERMQGAFPERLRVA